MNIDYILDSIFVSQYFKDNKEFTYYRQLAKNMLEVMYQKTKTIQDVFNLDKEKPYEVARLLASILDSEEVIDYLQDSEVTNSAILSHLIELHKMRGSPKIIETLANLYLNTFEVTYTENTELDKILIEVRRLEGDREEYDNQLKLFVKLSDRFLVAGVELLLVFMGYLLEYDSMNSSINEYEGPLLTIIPHKMSANMLESTPSVLTGISEKVNDSINKYVGSTGFPDMSKDLNLIMKDIEYNKTGLTLNTALYESTADLRTEITQDTDDMELNLVEDLSLPAILHIDRSKTLKEDSIGGAFFIGGTVGEFYTNTLGLITLGEIKYE